MVRTQIQLTKEQHLRLKALASERGESLAELIRQAVDLILDEPAREVLWDRLFEIAGAFHDKNGATDVSVRHDEYLADEIHDRKVRRSR